MYLDIFSPYLKSKSQIEKWIRSDSTYFSFIIQSFFLKTLCSNLGINFNKLSANEVQLNTYIVKLNITVDLDLDEESMHEN